MTIELLDRTEANVIEFYHKTQDKEIQRQFPFSVTTVEASLNLYLGSLEATATSYGKSIIIDQTYVGDVWVYNIDEFDDKMAMLSIVIFDKNSWGKGIGTKAMQLFTKACFQKYRIEKIGAFTYAHNSRSIKALKKAGFVNVEDIDEEGLASHYFELTK